MEEKTAMKKLYEAVPVEEARPEISTINICILENGSSLQMHYGYGGWSEAGHYDKSWMGSPVRFWLREVEVGSSVSTDTHTREVAEKAFEAARKINEDTKFPIIELEFETFEDYLNSLNPEGK